MTQLDYAEFLFKEDRLVEWAQVGCLIISCLIYYIASKKHNDIKEGFRILLLIALLGAVRELDRFFDHLLFEKAWQVLIAIISWYAIYNLWKNYQILKKQLHFFFNTRAFGLLFSGFLICIFSQVIGQKIFWKALMQEQYCRFAVRTVEECVEFFGYLIILMGTIELLFEKNSMSRKKKDFTGVERNVLESN